MFKVHGIVYCDYLGNDRTRVSAFILCFLLGPIPSSDGDQ